MLFALALLPMALLLPQVAFAVESPEDAHSKATDYMIAKYQGWATGSSGVTDNDIPIIFYIVGIHLGTTCTFYPTGVPPSENLCQTHNVEPGNIAIFSTWENVVARLNISSP